MAHLVEDLSFSVNWRKEELSQKRLLFGGRAAIVELGALGDARFAAPGICGKRMASDVR